MPSPPSPPVAPFELPAGFRFGVATAGFQVEGGFNGPGEPANNWAGWERAGRVEPSGIALDFWNDYEHHLDRAAAAGCDAYRLSVEWARCEPEPGAVDQDALARYRRILEACHARGLRPLVTLHHFTHPDWLGEEFWQALDAPERFASWVHTAVTALAPVCRNWVTINEINVLAVQSWYFGVFPPGHVLDARGLVRALDHLLTAHVLAYDTIKEIQSDGVVSTNPYPFSAYATERLLTDVLSARAHGVGRHDLRTWLAAREEEFHRTIPSHGARETFVRRWARSNVPLDQALPRACAAVYASPHLRTLDEIQLDWYDPRVDHKFRLPGHRTTGGRSWLPGRMLWDDPVDPLGLLDYLRAYEAPGLDLVIPENGLCNRVKRGVSYPRSDGWDRVSYLRANLGAVVAGIEAGLPLRGYYHWCLADNYEWGSYEPRFGLYGIDRERGVRWSSVDSMGGPAAEVYRALADGLRAGDTSGITRP
ncbi:MAG: family 1 glycosylhydrolase [Acidimicrobiales bacterium]